MTLSFEITIEQKDLKKLQSILFFDKKEAKTNLTTMYHLFNRFGLDLRPKVIIKQTNK